MVGRLNGPVRLEYHTLGYRRFGHQPLNHEQFRLALEQNCDFVPPGLTLRFFRWRQREPQAFRNMLPAVTSRFVALFMGTSLAYIIGVTEFFRAANNINNRVFESYVIYGFVAVVYFLCCYGLSSIGRYCQGRLDPASRASAEGVVPRPSMSA